MTTTYHTPIVTGAAANAATFNVVSSQLDSRLVTIDTAIDTDGTLKAGAVDGAGVLANNVVTNDKILNATITGAKLVAETVAAAQIANATITDAKMVASTLTAASIANATITGAKLVNGTITGTQIADATITGAKLVNATITGTQIADTTIENGKIANTTIADGKLAKPVRIAWAYINIGAVVSSVSAHTTSDTEWDLGLSEYAYQVVINRLEISGSTATSPGIIWDAWLVGPSCNLIVRATNVTASTVNIADPTSLSIGIYNVIGSLGETAESQVT